MNGNEVIYCASRPILAGPGEQLGKMNTFAEIIATFTMINNTYFEMFPSNSFLCLFKGSKIQTHSKSSTHVATAGVANATVFFFPRANNFSRFSLNFFLLVTKSEVFS